MRWVTSFVLLVAAFLMLGGLALLIDAGIGFVGILRAEDRPRQR